LLDVPDGTDIAIHMSASVVENMNQICRHMVGDWLWVIGDDHTFPRDIILRLLAHDVDIVVPLCARRSPPFSLVAFDLQEGEDEHGRPLYHVLQYDDIPDDGQLMEVAAAGTAGMLIRRHVLDELGYPWFRNSDGYSINEDVEFCRRAVAAGYKIMLDTTVAIGGCAAFCSSTVTAGSVPAAARRA
jgi:GT2 family glycosyltransferase